MIDNRLDHEVAGGVKDGRMWKVIERFLGNMHWYCGYVELLPQDYYYHYAATAEDELPAPGGITYTTDVYGPLEELPKGKKFIGFDTNHAFMEDYTQKMAVNETVELVELLNDLDGDSYEDLEEEERYPMCEACGREKAEGIYDGMWMCGECAYKQAYYDTYGRK